MVEQTNLPLMVPRKKDIVLVVFYRENEWGELTET